MIKNDDIEIDGVDDVEEINKWKDKIYLRIVKFYSMFIIRLVN